jgi:hypothetical protein
MGNGTSERPLTLTALERDGKGNNYCIAAPIDADRGPPFRGVGTLSSMSLWKLAAGNVKMTFKSALVAAGLLLTSTSAIAQPNPRNVQTPRTLGVSCSDFRLNADGSWSPVRKVTIIGPHGPFSAGPDEIFRIQLQGTTNYGVKVAQILNESCR